VNYQLFDLEIETVGDPATFNCSHRVGDGLIVKGENISFKPGTTYFSHYALGSLLPYIAAKQRAASETDWMSYETDIACPDPKCGARFRFKRLAETTYTYEAIHKASDQDV
jgi:uncharacterized repeat protein (TIGR04076 family)